MWKAKKSFIIMSLQVLGWVTFYFIKILMLKIYQYL